MDLKIAMIFLSLSFVAFVEADPCGRNKYLECFDAYGSASLEEMTEAIKCSNKRRLARCLTEFGHECYMDEYWKEHIETAFREAEKCNGVLEECLDESITVTSAVTCVEKSLRDLGNYVFGNPGQNKNRMMCTLVPLVVRCIIDDASDKCGQDATQSVVSKWMTAVPEELTKELMQRCTE